MKLYQVYSFESFVTICTYKSVLYQIYIYLNWNKRIQKAKIYSVFTDSETAHLFLKSICET